MTLLRFIQRASILAGMTFASLSVYGNPAHADDALYCVIASNGKTACGTLKAVERACITTAAGSTVCGKYKSAKEETTSPAPNSGYRKEVDNFVYTLEGCQRVDTSVRCQIKMVNKGKERSMYSQAPKSSLVDSTGKSHPGSKVDLGGSPSDNAGFTIAPNTDAYFGITFENVSGVKAQLLNLNISDRSIIRGGVRPIQFRNVPISN